MLRPPIEAGQIQLMNHTYDHKDLTVMTPALIGADLERDEDWIAKTFHASTGSTSGRPSAGTPRRCRMWRPPSDTR